MKTKGKFQKPCFIFSMNCLKKNLFQQFVIFSIYFFSLVLFNVCLAQKTDFVLVDEKRVLIKPKKSKNLNLKLDEKGYKRIYAMENMAQLPFKEFPYKPIYKREVSAEMVEESKNIKEFALKQEFTIFEINEQKNKDKKKNEQKMLAFNEGRNKKFFDYLKRLEKFRSQPANLKGFRYDYTNHLQNYEMISKQ